MVCNTGKCHLQFLWILQFRGFCNFGQNKNKTSFRYLCLIYFCLACSFPSLCDKVTLKTIVLTTFNFSIKLMFPQELSHVTKSFITSLNFHTISCTKSLKYLIFARPLGHYMVSIVAMGFPETFPVRLGCVILPFRFNYC